MSLSAEAPLLSRIKPLHVLYLISALLVLVIWVPRLHDALFVDEAGSYWIIHDGAAHIIERTFSTQGETPFYYFILAGWTALFGLSELAMRSLSFLASIGTMLSLFWLGRLRNSWAYFLAVPILITSRLEVFSAVTARPYALGIFFAALSIAAFAEWLREDSKLFLLLSAVSYGFALDCHPTIAPAVFVHLYLLWEYKPSQARLFDLIVPVLLGVLAASPAISQFFTLTGKVNALSIVTDRPGLGTVVRFFVSFPMFVAIILGPLILILHKTILRQEPQWHFQGADFALAGVWYVIPKFFIFFVALVLSPTFFVPRYSLFASIGEALIIGTFLAAITDRYWRFGLATAVLIAMGARGVTMQYPDTAWRPALQYVEKHGAGHRCTIFALTGFIESKNFDLMKKEPTASFIRSPLSYYNLDDAVLLPLSVSTQEEEEYLKEKAFPAIDGKKCAILLRWDIGAYDSIPQSGPSLLTAYLKKRNFDLQSEIEFGTVTLFHWEARS